MTLVGADALAFVARFFVAGFFAPRPFDVVDGLFADRALGVLAIPIFLPKRTVPHRGRTESNIGSAKVAGGDRIRFQVVVSLFVLRFSCGGSGRYTEARLMGGRGEKLEEIGARASRQA